MSIKVLTEDEVHEAIVKYGIRDTALVDEEWERTHSGEIEAWADGDGIVFLRKYETDRVIFDYYGVIDDVVKFLTTAYGHNLVVTCYLTGDDYAFACTIMFLKSGFQKYSSGATGGIVEMRYANV